MAIAPVNKFVSIAVPVAPGLQKLYEVPTGTSALLLYTQVANVGIGTTQFTTAMVGAGNSFQGMYISNGMTIYDNELNGNHYISTNFNGLMAGPVTVNGVLTVDGNYVVV